MSAGFFRRMGAYIIDIFIVLLVASLISSFVPNRKVNDLYSDYNEFIFESYTQYNDNDFDLEGFDSKLEDYTYEISKLSTVSNLILISLYFLYFIGFNRYNNGQTVGKKLLKIETIDMEGNVPSLKQLFIRGIILYPIIFDILRVILILVLSKSLFLSLSPILTVIRFIILVVCAVSIIVGNDGIHDKISGTRVILYDSMDVFEDNATKWKKNSEKEKKIKNYKNNHTSGKKRG